MLQHEPVVSINLRNGRAKHCLFHHTATRIPWIGHWEEIPTCLRRTQGWPSRGCTLWLRAHCTVLHLLSAQQKEISPFQTCSCAAAEGDLATEHPPCHQITTHLGKIQMRRKAERGGTGVRIGWSSSPVCAAGQMEFVMFCFCCARAMWNFPLPEKGNGRKKKENKQENKPLQGACCCCRKNRYQIKNLCLKTVHMPAPGDLKYLWFATFLIFKISRDVVSRTGCKLIPCLTWMWLVTCNCSGGKGTAASLKGSWGSHLTWWGFHCALEGNLEISPYALTLALLCPSYSITALWNGLSPQAGRCRGEMMPRRDGAHCHHSKTPYPTSVTVTKESPILLHGLNRLIAFYKINNLKEINI